MPSLPDNASRRRADRFDVFHYQSYEQDGWLFREWRLKAFCVSGGAPLEPWWPEPVVGRVRLKRWAGIGADLGDLAALSCEPFGVQGVTEILNVELQPAFLGQGLGVTLLRAALADIPDQDIVVCEPTPSEYSNVPLEASSVAVSAFYEGLGFAADDRLPGYLTARRVDLAL